MSDTAKPFNKSGRIAVQFHMRVICNCLGYTYSIIIYYHPPKDNLTKEQRKALKEQKDLEDEVILPVDKGNAIMVMRREDYSTKVKGMLETSTY